MPARRNKKSPSVVYYPVFLNLSGKKAVVVGGGRVAERKVLSLLKAGADITVISPSLTRTLQREKARNAIRHHPRNYRRGDLGKAFLVISATDSPDINKKIAEDAPALINVVDVPAQSNFISPSVVARGALAIAISTGGASPALSKTVRKELEILYGVGFSKYLAFLRRMRSKVMAQIEDKKRREAFLKDLASPGMLTLLRKQGIVAVKAKIQENFEAILKRS